MGKMNPDHNCFLVFTMGNGVSGAVHDFVHPQYVPHFDMFVDQPVALEICH